jgi:hypothetical protein
MEVGERAPLQFNNFHKGHARVLWVLRPISLLTDQEPPKLNRKATPEFWSMPRKEYVSGVVVAAITQRLSERGIIVVVCSFALARTAVRALPPVGAARMTAAGRTSRVDGTEAGRCEGHEHLGMLGNGGGYFMMSAAKAGVDQLPGVTGV